MRLLDGTLSPRLGAKEDTDISVSVPPDSEVRKVGWGFSDRDYSGFKLIDPYNEILICKTWGEADPAEIKWQYKSLLRGEKLVGFYGYLYSFKEH